MVSRHRFGFGHRGCRERIACRNNGRTADWALPAPLRRLGVGAGRPHLVATVTVFGVTSTRATNRCAAPHASASSLVRRCCARRSNAISTFRCPCPRHRGSRPPRETGRARRRGQRQHEAGGHRQGIGRRRDLPAGPGRADPQREQLEPATQLRRDILCLSTVLHRGSRDWGFALLRCRHHDEPTRPVHRQGGSGSRRRHSRDRRGQDRPRRPAAGVAAGRRARPRLRRGRRRLPGSEPAWKYRPFHPLAPVDTARIQAARQYGDSDLRSLLRDRPTGGRSSFPADTAPCPGLSSGPRCRISIGRSGTWPRPMPPCVKPCSRRSPRDRVPRSRLRPRRSGQRRQRLRSEQPCASPSRDAWRSAPPISATANARLRGEIAERERATAALRATQEELIHAGRLAALGRSPRRSTTRSISRWRPCAPSSRVPPSSWSAATPRPWAGT